MSHVYVIGDLHFGQKTVCNLRKQFTSMEEHDDYIISRWNSIVRKADMVYVMGDVAANKEGLAKMKFLKGKKILIMGNHDSQFKATELLEHFHDIKGVLRKKGCWFSHCPMHEDELFGRPSIHGHMHFRKLENPLYFNTCCEFLDYTPMRLDEILKQIKEAIR